MFCNGARWFASRGNPKYIDEFETRPYSLSILGVSFPFLVTDQADHGIDSMAHTNSFVLKQTRYFSYRMEAVFAWCKGVKFLDVQKLTDSFEGTTIRTLRRLEELVRQITSAAKAIGDHELETKFEEGGKLLKRDIVFCSSLYL